MQRRFDSLTIEPRRSGSIQGESTRRAIWCQPSHRRFGQRRLAGPGTPGRGDERNAFRKYAADIAWETEVWIAATPDHMIHFDGPKFLGPYLM